MKRNVLSFFKSSACAKSFFVFGAAFLAILSISCKQLASFDPVVNGEQVVVGGGGNSGGDTSSLEAAEFSFNLKATHGLMRKISLEWTAFSGAKYYEIYFAESAAAEFTKIGETEQPFFDDAVAAGRTGYFKVCAVKANGSSTPFSSTVVGTSLAVPIIGGGEVNASSASISWFMENARGIDGTDYYEKSLKFEVVCQSKGESEGGENKVLSASSFSSTSYSYTFEELSSSKDYEFYVAAYLESDTQSRETSPTVDKTTLTTYTPLSPKFSASEGDSAKGISLLITLPEMVTVKTFVKESENQNIMQDVSYPLCFKVFRKHEKEKTYSEKNAVTLYYNGTNLTTSPVEYQEAGAPYEVGAQVTWFDGDASLIGGEKYDYMIRSFVDINYSKVVCVEGKEYETETGTPLDKANTSQGWKSAPPSFNVKVAEDGGRKLSADNTKVVSVSFGFSAEWNDLGKAGDYKFAIRQTYAPFTSESGTSAWLKNGETIYFDTLDGIKALVKTFGSDSGLPKAEQGTYSYTLYVVSKNDNGTSDIESNDNVLDSVNARDKMVVTEEVQLPKAELSVQGGYKNKVHYKFACEQGVKYRLERTKIVDGKPTDKPEYIELNNTPASGTFEGDDTTVQDNCSYSYVLKAVAASGVPALSTAQEAETLGTPVVSFDDNALSYDSVAITFKGVLSAKEYVVTLGESGGFGGGKKCSFAADGTVTSGNAEVKLSVNEYTVTIKQPEGYNDVTKAGKTADASVTAGSDVDYAQSDGVAVNVLGPALLDAKVNTFAEASENSISLTWNKVDDANGYLIRRVMYEDVAMTKVADGSGITYYCDASGKEIMAEGEKVYEKRADVVFNETNRKFTLTDTYKENELNDIDKPDRVRYQKAQAKIFWGLPFRYVVLPVFKADDFDFEGIKLVGGEVTYTNLEPTGGTATLGYGMEVHAEKSKNTKEQVITWVKPFYATDTVPRVFRRLVTGSSKSDFALVNDSTELATGANSFAYNPQGDDKYNAYEYVVQYGVVSVPTLNQDLLKDFEGRKDAESPTEQANKGYLFTVEDFNLKTSKLAAEHGGSNTYAETVTWDTNMKPWEYKNRALGPTGIKLYIMNNNIDGEWHPVAKIGSMDYSGKVESLGDDISAEKGSDGISLYPKGIANGSSGTTSGMLKVLRDYKHYYALSLTRDGNDDEELETQKYTPGFKDDYDYMSDTAVYAYRQITIDEFAKAAIIGMSTGIEKERGTKGSKNDGDGITGLKSTSSYNASTDFTLTFKYDNYVARHATKSGEEAYAVKINGTLKARGGTTDAYQSQYFSKENITITYENLGTGTIYLNGKDEWLSWNKGTYPVNRTKGTIDITYNGLSKTYDMSKSSENGWTLPFTLTGGNLNNSEEWQ